MKIFKSTNKKDHILLNNEIKHIATWEDNNFRIFINGEKTSLFSVELSKREI